jgi:hypothetical protein
LQWAEASNKPVVLWSKPKFCKCWFLLLGAIAQQLERAAAKEADGIKHKQPSVTVGAVRELDALLGLRINSKDGNRHGWRRLKSCRLDIQNCLTQCVLRLW